MKRTALIAATATGIVVLLVTGLPAYAARLITGNDIQNGSITRKDVRKGTLTLDRLSQPTQRLILTKGQPGPKGNTGSKGNTGARGLTGARGATGAAGARGANGVSGYQVVPLSSTLAAGAAATLSVPCPAGKVVIGGGGQVVSGTAGVITAGYPGPNQTWVLNATADPAGQPWQINGYAICATAT
jgi:hypothetical protein